MYVSRLAGGLFAAGLTFWCGTGTAAAQLLYEQLPSGPAYNHAYWSSPVPGYAETVFAADSFQLTEPKLLSRITWWGIYGYYGQDGVPPLPEYESFVINIYADNAGQPGAVLATFETGVDTTSRTATGRTQYWPYEQWIPEHEQHYATDEYSYKYTLPTPFPIEANTTYWLGILSKHALYAPSARWNWSHSASPNSLGVMRGYTDGNTPVTWEPVIDPWDNGISGVLANAAFRLDSFAPPSYAVYEQPSANGGSGVNASPIGTEWADSFVMSSASTIKRIVWWGGLDGGTYYEPHDFTIRIYADDAGQPGAEIASYAVGEATQYANDGWLEPPPPGEECCGLWSEQYEYILPTPLAVQANTRYWIGIVNARSEENWLWQASDTGHEAGLQFRAATPAGGSWTALTAGPIHDLAFRIETAPLPAYEQRPSHEYLWGTLPFQPGTIGTAADSFQLTSTTQITRISWWGAYRGTTWNPMPGSDNFTVHIMADANGSPGAVVATYTPGDQVFRTPTGKLAEIAWPGFTPQAEYFHSLALPSPLTLQANTRYWITINTTPYPNYTGFVWECAFYTGGTGIYASSADPLTGPWTNWPVSMSFRLDY
jgi:hypothetical protein